MVDEAHGLGVRVKPWTVNRHNIVDQLLDWKVDGIISDCSYDSLLTLAVIDCFALDPNAVRRLIKHRQLPAAPKYPKERVLACLDEHLSRQRQAS